MSTILRRLLRRVVLFEKATGNVLDVPARRILASEVPEVEESRVPDSEGGTRPRTRTHRVQIRLASDEESRLARLMAESCDVGLLALGAPATKHLMWEEATTLSRVPASSGALQVASDVLTLESRIFDPAIWGGTDLLAGVPWAGTAAEAGDTFYTLGARTPNLASHLDLGRGHDGKLKAVIGDAGVYDLFSSDFLLGGSDNVGIDYDGTNYVIANDDVDGPFITRTDNTGTDDANSPYTYPGNTPGSLAYYRPEDLCYVVDSSGDVYVLDGTNGFALLRTFKPQSQTPTALAVDGDELLIIDTTGAIQVWDLSTVTADGEKFEQSYDGRAWDGIVVKDSVLYGQMTGESRVDVLSRQRLAPIGRETWTGPFWGAPAGASVSIVGTASGLGANAASLELIFPAWLAELKLVASEDGSLTASYEALGWDGTLLGSGDATQSFEVPIRTWALRLVVESATKGLALKVLSSGDTFGVIEGGVTADCTNRVADPYWNDPNVVLTGEDV